MPDDPLIQLDQAMSDRIRRLAEKEKVDVATVFGQMIDHYERYVFRKDVTESFRRLCEDPVVLKEYQDEMRVWDATLMDGLEDDPWLENDETAPNG